MLPVKSDLAAESSTFELIRPSLFHLSTSDALAMNFLLFSPMFDGSRFPALFFPKM